MELLSSLLRSFVGILATLSVIIFVLLGISMSSIGGYGIVIGIIMGGAVGLIFAVASFGTVAVLLNIEENTENTTRGIQALLNKLENQSSLPGTSTKEREQEKATLAAKPLQQKPKEISWHHNGYDIKRIDDKLTIVGINVGDKSFRFVDDVIEYIEANLPDKYSGDDNS